MSNKDNVVQRTFARNYLTCILWKETPDNQIISDEMVDVRRWTILHRLVFKHEDKFYAVHYERGATEHQEVTPWEYEGEEIVCTEVTPVEKITIVYEPLVKV